MNTNEKLVFPPDALAIASRALYEELKAISDSWNEYAAAPERVALGGRLERLAKVAHFVQMYGLAKAAFTMSQACKVIEQSEDGRSIRQTLLKEVFDAIQCMGVVAVSIMSGAPRNYQSLVRAVGNLVRSANLDSERAVLAAYPSIELQWYANSLTTDAVSFHAAVEEVAMTAVSFVEAVDSRTMARLDDLYIDLRERLVMCLQFNHRPDWQPFFEIVCLIMTRPPGTCDLSTFGRLVDVLIRLQSGVEELEDNLKIVALETALHTLMVAFDGPSQVESASGSINRGALIRLVSCMVKAEDDRSADVEFAQKLAGLHREWDRNAVLNRLENARVLTERLSKAPHVSTNAHYARLAHALHSSCVLAMDGKIAADSFWINGALCLLTMEQCVLATESFSTVTEQTFIAALELRTRTGALGGELVQSHFMSERAAITGFRSCIEELKRVIGLAIDTTAASGMRREQAISAGADIDVRAPEGATKLAQDFEACAAVFCSLRLHEAAIVCRSLAEAAGDEETWIPIDGSAVWINGLAALSAYTEHAKFSGIRDLQPPRLALAKTQAGEVIEADASSETPWGAAESAFATAEEVNIHPLAQAETGDLEATHTEVGLGPSWETDVTSEVTSETQPEEASVDFQDIASIPADQGGAYIAAPAENNENGSVQDNSLDLTATTAADVCASSSGHGLSAAAFPAVESIGEGVKFGEATEQDYPPAEQLFVRINEAFDGQTDTIRYGSAIVPILIKEVDGQLKAILVSIEVMRQVTDRTEAFNAVLRDCHGMKGAFRTGGCQKGGALIHAIEDDLANFTPATLPIERLDSYQLAMDKVASYISEIEAAAAEPQAGLAAVAGPVHDAGAGEQVPVEPTEVAAQMAPRTQRSAATSPTESITRLGQRSSEVLILQSRSTADLALAHSSLRTLATAVSRLDSLAAQLAEEAQYSGSGAAARGDGAIDPMELERFGSLQEIQNRIVEALADLRTSEADILANLQSLEETNDRKTAVSTELQREASSLMVTSLSSRFMKMESTVRLAAQDLGKKATVRFEGDADLSSGVAVKLQTALDHILRNAVAHGIEAEAERLQRGKPPGGQITVRAVSTPESTQLAISDDGAGIDVQKVLAKARSMGLADSRDYADGEVFEFLFNPGFSTAATISATAGRGVGLDAVRGSLEAMGAKLTISSKIGAGTTFTIEIPRDVTLLPVVPVEAAGTTWYIPAQIVERIVSITGESAREAAGKGYITANGEDYRFTRMAWLTAEESPPNAGRSSHVLLCRTPGTGLHAFEVDTVRPTKKVLVRQLGRHLMNLAGVVAGVIGERGAVSMIINPLRMKVLGRDIGTTTGPVLPLCLVVDDSATVRLTMERAFAQLGMEVELANDGADGLDKARELRPDLILLDVEMPRMNGFDVLEAIKSDPSLAHIPIVMVTSRSGPQHRERALALGATDYLAKPFDEGKAAEVLHHIGLAERLNAC